MSLLDEQDLDQLWEDIGDNYLAWVWARDHSNPPKGDSTSQHFELHRKFIVYSYDERKWMLENNIPHDSSEQDLFFAFIPGSFSEFRDFVNRISEFDFDGKPHLITKPFTDLSTAPPILHNLFQVGGWEDIKGKAYGFYTRSN